MMGGAMIRGLVKTRCINVANIFASDVDQARICELRSDTAGFDTEDRTTAYLIEKCEVIVIAVEPKDVPQVCGEIQSAQREVIRREKVCRSRLIISLAAGVTLASLESWLPTRVVSPQELDSFLIARVMPNTPCVVGEMAAGYVCNQRLRDEPAWAACLGDMLGALGSAMEVTDEADLDAVTGVAGSAPAYVFQFIEAMSDGGVRCGLRREVATTLAARTVLGAAKMVLETGRHPGALKDEVTSPGGTTIAAIHALESGGMRAAVMNAVVAAAEKSRELGQAGGGGGSSSGGRDRKRARKEEWIPPTA